MSSPAALLTRPWKGFEVKIAVVVARSLQGGGFATRVSSMPVRRGQWLRGGALHYRHPHEARLPSSVEEPLNRYVTVSLQSRRYRQHATLLAALAWQCLQDM